LRYLALGDSYSIGEGVADAGRWPQQLAVALRAHGIALADPQIIATTGWTTDQLQAGIDAAQPQGPFDLVSLLIGVNNQYRGRSIDEYRSQFERLLQRAIGFADGRAGRVLVLSIPDWGLTPYAQANHRDAALIASELDAFNAVAHACCQQHGVAFVDITGISRDRGSEAEMLVEDGLHPSATMYQRWAAQALPVAAALLA
jgi:lysophospholipase L1-like esterase